MTPGSVYYAHYEDTLILKLVGDIRLNWCGNFDVIANHTIKQNKSQCLIVDLTEVTFMDSTSLGLLAKIALESKFPSHTKPIIVYKNYDIYKILLSMRLENIFDMIEKSSCYNGNLELIEDKNSSDLEVCARSLEAHKALMQFSADNKIQFAEVVSTLEKEIDQNKTIK